MENLNHNRCLVHTKCGRGFQLRDLAVEKPLGPEEDFRNTWTKRTLPDQVEELRALSAGKRRNKKLNIGKQPTTA